MGLLDYRFIHLEYRGESKMREQLSQVVPRFGATAGRTNSHENARRLKATRDAKT